MKIFTAVPTLPVTPSATPHPAHRPDRRLAYAAAKRSAGLWVPVECENYREALYLANGARRHASLNIEAEQRGQVVYLRYIGRVGNAPTHPPSHALASRASIDRIAQCAADSKYPEGSTQ